MNRQLSRKFLMPTLSGVAVVLLSGLVARAQNAGNAASSAPDGAQTQQSSPTGQRSDGQIEMDVVHALDSSSALKKDLITAATIQGEVTLSGTVSSEASKELAESIATHVNGVTAVHNNLKVGNPSEAQDMPQPAQSEVPGVPGDSANENPQDDGPVPPPQSYPQQTPEQPADRGQVQPAYPPQPGYAPQPGYPPQQSYPHQRPSYNPAEMYDFPKGPVTVPAGTLLQVRTSEAVGTKNAKAGTPVEFVVIHDIALGNLLAIPRGAVVHGVVTESQKAGAMAGSPSLALALTSLDLGGQSYNLQSDEFKVKGPNKAGRTVGSALGAGMMGTIIGCAVGGGTGCAIGAGAGVAAGSAASAASPSPSAWIPAEALVDFHLKAPVTVNPVTPKEAARLAQAVDSRGPTLNRRAYYPYGYARPYPAYYPYGYAYPPVYYRPYYYSGGFYYWR